MLREGRPGPIYASPPDSAVTFIELGRSNSEAPAVVIPASISAGRALASDRAISGKATIAGRAEVSDKQLTE